MAALVCTHVRYRGIYLYAIFFQCLGKGIKAICELAGTGGGVGRANPPLTLFSSSLLDQSTGNASPVSCDACRKQKLDV